MLSEPNSILSTNSLLANNIKRVTDGVGNKNKGKNKGNTELKVIVLRHLAAI
jgi:hypothetical protein